jgi:hypothetical protein
MCRRSFTFHRFTNVGNLDLYIALSRRHVHTTPSSVHAKSLLMLMVVSATCVCRDRCSTNEILGTKNSRWNLGFFTGQPSCIWWDRQLRYIENYSRASEMPCSETGRIHSCILTSISRHLPSLSGSSFLNSVNQAVISLVVTVLFPASTSR